MIEAGSCCTMRPDGEGILPDSDTLFSHTDTIHVCSDLNLFLQDDPNKIRTAITGP